LTKRNFILILLLILASCGKPKTIEKKVEEAKIEETRSRYDIFVSKNSYQVFNEKYEQVRREDFTDTIIGASIFEKTLYILSSSLYSVNLSNLQISNRGQIINLPSSDRVISNRQGVIFISGENLVFKDKSKEQYLLSCDSPIKNMWENPYHNYIYCIDSLGFLYAIDLQTKTLKRRFFIGRLNSFSFMKYGTRILAVTDKSFLVLDYETLNIIFERKDFFTEAISFETNDLMFLYSGIDKKCWIYSNIDYKKIKDFITNENDLSLFTSDDSLILLFSKLKKTMTLFNREKKIAKKTVKMEGDLSMLLFEGEKVYLKNDSFVFVYDMKNDSSKKIGHFPKLLAMKPFLLEKKIIATAVDTSAEKKKTEIYSIQVYALSNKDYAGEMADQLKDKLQTGNVFVSDTVFAGKTVFRVFIGKFESKEEADLLREELVRKGFGRDIMVKRVTADD